MSSITSVFGAETRGKRGEEDRTTSRIFGLLDSLRLCGKQGRKIRADLLGSLLNDNDPAKRWFHEEFLEKRIELWTPFDRRSIEIDASEYIRDISC